MPSRAWVVTSWFGFLLRWKRCFNALSGLSCYASFLDLAFKPAKFQCPLGLELLQNIRPLTDKVIVFQCPLGLIPHFYKIEAFRTNNLERLCQCPLGLIPHFYAQSSLRVLLSSFSVNALSGLYLISTYPFKNLGFMRFPEPVFAGIYQNILTTAVFRAC